MAPPSKAELDTLAEMGIGLDNIARFLDQQKATFASDPSVDALATLVLAHTDVLQGFFTEMSTAVRSYVSKGDSDE